MTLRFARRIPRPDNPTSHATPPAGRHEPQKTHDGKADQ